MLGKRNYNFEIFTSVFIKCFDLLHNSKMGIQIAADDFEQKISLSLALSVFKMMYNSSIKGELYINLRNKVSFFLSYEQVLKFAYGKVKKKN